MACSRYCKNVPLSAPVSILRMPTGFRHHRRLQRRESDRAYGGIHSPEWLLQHGDHRCRRWFERSNSRSVARALRANPKVSYSHPAEWRKIGSVEQRHSPRKISRYWLRWMPTLCCVPAPSAARPAFRGSRIGAVSGNARVGNRQKWLTRFQSIEYIYGFNLDRRALDYLNAITVVPGAVGAWRKQLVLDCGGFLHDTLAEDTDLTLAIRRLGYVIRYEQDAVAYTEAPGRYAQPGETAISLGVRNSAGGLETSRRIIRSEIRHAWLHRLAEHLDFSSAALGPLAFRRDCHDFLPDGRRLENCSAVLRRFLCPGVAYRLPCVCSRRASSGDLSLLFFQTIYYRQLMLYVLGKSFLFAIRAGWSAGENWSGRRP